MLLARGLGVKVVAHIHGSKLDIQFRNSGWSYKQLMKLAFYLPTQIIVLSEYWQKLVAEEISPRLNTIIVPNCVDWSIAKAMDHSFAPEKKECLVLFVGWLSMRKGILDALHAAELVHQQLPDAHFVFAGTLEPGLQMEEVKLACTNASSEGHSSFPGFVGGEGKISLFKKASIFTLPSYHENLPVSILEAMAMGLPVVATNIAGVPEMIEDGRNGFLIQPGDYRFLSEQIIRLANDPELRQTMGKANIAKVREFFHPRVFTLKISQLYESLIEN